MGRKGDDPPVAGRPAPVDKTDAAAKRGRRRRRGKRSRWPYAAPRDASARLESGPDPGRAEIAHALGLPVPPAPPGRSSPPANLPVAEILAEIVSEAPLGAEALVLSLVGDLAVPEAHAMPAPEALRTELLNGTAPAGLLPAADPGPAEAPAVPPGFVPTPHPADRMFDPGRLAPTAPPRRGRGMPLYAALDLGTNNCRLLVAEPQRTGFRVVDAFSRIVRLGEGLSSAGRLSEAAQDRAVEALHICRMKLDLRGVARARLVATEACRIAENGETFLDRVYAETGLDLEIVSRETEARLAVAGCASLVDWQSDGVILFDIGGGSSELVWLDLARGNRNGDLTRHIRAWTSLPVGVVTLSERHGGVIVDRDGFEAMIDHVDAMLDGLDASGALGRALATGRFHMLGTSGTVTTLAGVHLGLKRYDRRRVDGTWLDDADVGRMIRELLAMSYEERVANPCIGADRADLVLAGCAILEAIRRRWPCERLRVADRGLREGILTELMAADGVWRR